MPYYNGEKWACSSCTKGHRSSKCMHTDRILYKVRKPGRPLNNCPHILPEKIKPGTFVNTSATSMANGDSPKEPCGCKGGQLEVAIPKVKHCSCMSTTNPSDPPAPTQTSSENTPGVKSGRVTKKQNRRRKSMITEEMLEAAKEDAAMHGTANISSTEAIPKFEMDRSLPTHSSFPTDSGRQAQQINHPFPQAPLVETGFPAQQLNNLLPQWQPQNQHLINGTILTSPPLNMQHNSPLHPQQPAPASQNQSSDQFTMTGQAGGPLYMGGMPSQTPDFFSGFPKTNAPQMVIPENSSTSVVMASFNSGPMTPSHTNGMNYDKIMVPLTHHEYLWIQHARSSGVDFSKLPKFISEIEGSLHGVPRSTQFSPPQPSPIGFRASTKEDPPTPAIPSFPESAKSKGGGGCCKSKSVPSPAEDISTGPSSPRCKCGEACRCVPCADHPFNPAMLEAIKGDMLLIQEPGQRATKKSSSSSSTCNGTTQNSDQENSPSTYEQDNYNDENSPANSASGSIMADFNFVFQNYNYGGGCTEGQGGCMCGEGCTCVGCLTHGGHDGVSLEMLRDATTAGIAEVNENGVKEQHCHGQEQNQGSGPGHAP